MVVPTWIEFIAARNGTSSAGSSSPVLEKCSNSSAKNINRCRSLRPGGNMSVESLFLTTGIGGNFWWQRGAVLQLADERRLKAPHPRALSVLIKSEPIML